MKGLVSLSKCEWLTYSKLLRVEKVAPPGFEPATYISRNEQVNYSATAPQHRELSNVRIRVNCNLILTCKKSWMNLTHERWILHKLVIAEACIRCIPSVQLVAASTYPAESRWNWFRTSEHEPRLSLLGLPPADIEESGKNSSTYTVDYWSTMKDLARDRPNLAIDCRIWRMATSQQQ